MTEVPPKVAAAFEALAWAQRGEPEEAMSRAQHALGGGVLSFVIEHVGDLIHRMTESVSWPHAEAGHEYVSDKVRKSLRVLQNAYDFAREHDENMRSNAQFRGVPLQEHLARADAALEAYARAHEALPVYNRAQRLARGASVALGRKDFSAAEGALVALKHMAETPEKWVAHATECSVDAVGEPVPLNPGDDLSRRRRHRFASREST